MIEIVNDSFALSSQVVTTAEKMAKAKDWARLLFDVIPESKLQECFRRARETHNSTFAISGYELEAAYRALPPPPKPALTLEEKQAMFARQNYHRKMPVIIVPTTA